MTDNSRSVAVVGAGAWGTALAIAAARAGTSRVTLLARRPERAQAMASSRCNPPYLPGVVLDPAIEPGADPNALKQASVVILAVPAQSLRAVLGELSLYLPADAVLLIAAKGIERGSHLRMTQVVQAIRPGNPRAVLSGPSFATEVARGLPTAVTIAADQAALADSLTRQLGSRTFRPYPSDDLIGVELGGAAKNVLAIACGIGVGLGLGDNARAALVTRGLAEMTRFGVALGGHEATFAGLSGLGDLVLTCAGLQSRNLRFGIALGEGCSIEAAHTTFGTVEGVDTAGALVALAAEHDVELPIAEAVAAVIAGRLTVSSAVEGLLARPFREERAGNHVTPDRK